jgi:hypothetical protein
MGHIYIMYNLKSTPVYYTEQVSSLSPFSGRITILGIYCVVSPNDVLHDVASVPIPIKAIGYHFRIG